MLRPCVLVCLGAILLTATACNLHQAGAQSAAPSGRVQSGVPLDIGPEYLGPQSFLEEFATFDHGVDQERPAKPHRWRTVYGIGPMSPDNRSETANNIDHVYIDPEFGGLTGCAPLGIDPFVATPGQVVIQATRLTKRQAGCLGRGWASGLMTTAFSFSQKWGYFEAELSLPTEAGFWPAFWLLPTEGPWPEHGEIDALESVGPATPGGQPKAHVGIVWKSPTDGSRSGLGGYTNLITPGFHTYGVLWTPTTVNFYFDRRLTSSVDTPSDYTFPMYMLIDLAVGAKESWPGAPTSDTHQAQLVVRRVAAWKLKSDQAN